MKHHIIVTVQGGVAEVCEDTLPPGAVVEILDFDNLAADEGNEMSCWSPELREYWMKNHKGWGRCGEQCPCGQMQDVEKIVASQFARSTQVRSLK